MSCDHTISRITGCFQGVSCSGLQAKPPHQDLLCPEALQEEVRNAIIRRGLRKMRRRVEVRYALLWRCCDVEMALIQASLLQGAAFMRRMFEMPLLLSISSALKRILGLGLQSSVLIRCACVAFNACQEALLVRAARAKLTEDAISPGQQQGPEPLRTTSTAVM